MSCSPPERQPPAHTASRGEDAAPRDWDTQTGAPAPATRQSILTTWPFGQLPGQACGDERNSVAWVPKTITKKIFVIWEALGQKPVRDQDAAWVEITTSQAGPVGNPARL